MLGLTIKAGLATKTLAAASLPVINIDTTGRDNAIAFPTDARGPTVKRAAPVRMAKKSGIALKQSFYRLGQQALMTNGRYAHAWQIKRTRREPKQHTRNLDV